MISAQLAVVGAGPAGLSAAVEAAKTGVRVAVFDEQRAPGGQLVKQIHKFFGSKAHKAGVRGVDIGRQLLEEALALGVEIHLDTVVWGIFEGNALGVARDGHIDRVAAERVLLATGAQENMVPFPGWTLPGVLGAGAAQTMVNLHRVLPGKRVVMIGSGNVGLIVAYQLLQAGAEVAALVEGADHVGGYAVHANKLRRMGVPILTSHTVREVSGRDGVERVGLVEVDRQWKPVPGTERELAADTVCIAAGLSPLAELAWMAGARFSYVKELGGHVPLHGPELETTVAGLYVAGDVTGVEEASTAMEEGRLAGVEIARSLDRLAVGPAEALGEEIRAHLRELRQGPFGDLRQACKERLFQEYRQGCEPRRGAAPAAAAPAGRQEGVAAGPAAAPAPTGPCAIIECSEAIPCNPCVEACEKQAIRIDGALSGLPRLDRDKCKGCGLCIAHCPGLAIFTLDPDYSPAEALLRLPYEFLPLPQKGEQVIALDREGKRIGRGRVQGVSTTPAFDRTPVVSLLLPKEIAPRVRHFARA